MLASLWRSREWTNDLPHLRPSWTRNLGALLDEGIRVTATCQTCNRDKDVDLAMMADKLGRDYELWNRRPRCNMTPGCAGRVLFRHSGRGIMRAMEDAEWLAP